MVIEPGEKRAPRSVGEQRVTPQRLSAQFPALVRGLQGGDELAPEDLGQCLDWKQKAALGRHPMPIGLERPAGHQCMDMHVPPQVLTSRYAAPA